MIELVEYSEKHRDSLVKLLNNVNVEKWLLQIPSPYTYDDADFWINRCKNSKDEKNDLSFPYAIMNDGMHVGGIGLRKKLEHSAEIGYWIGEEYWRKGFASAALKKLLDIGFKDLNFSRIQAHVFDRNIASERLLLKCGFEYEGLLKKCHVKKGVFYNSKLFAKVVD